MTTRTEGAEEWISNIEDKFMENNKAENKRERKILDREWRLRELRDSRKDSIHLKGVPEEEERERGEKINLSKL